MRTRRTFAMAARTIFVLGALPLFTAATTWGVEPPPPVPSPQQIEAPFLKPAKPLSKEQIKAKAEELRKKYPFESVAKRLTYEDHFAEASKDRPAPELNEDAKQHLETLEVSGQRGWNNRRPAALSMLHSDQVERFISSEGFGISRLPPPTVHDLELADGEPVRYPRYLLESTESQTPEYGVIPRTIEETVNPWKLPAREILFGYHLNGQLNFAGANSLGLVRDRDHVSGFRSHQFRSLPTLVTVAAPPRQAPSAPETKPAEEWVLRKLELVSLLKHKEPAVYISATLPKMNELDSAKTREPSTFEADSLKSLRSGESLVARASANHLEMVGALRAGKQCQQCHQVQRGELLGAFSYELHRSPELHFGKNAAGGGQ